jgi:hypothetical protein
MAGEADQTLLTASDAAASDAKAASSAESDTAPTSSSSNAITQKIVKKDIPMLQDYWKKLMLTEADRAAYHAAG